MRGIVEIDAIEEDTMRPRAMIAAAALGAALTISTSAALVAAAPDDSTSATMHHGGNVHDMVPMHDAMADAYPGMDTHMNELGIDPDQMRDWMVDNASHDQMHQRLADNGVAPDGMHDDAAGMGNAHGSGSMHD